MEEYRLSQEDDPKPGDILTISRNLQAYNVAQVGYGDELYGTLEGFAGVHQRLYFRKVLQ